MDNTGSGPLTTRRAVLAASGAVALGSLAGCTALGGLVDRASQEAVANRNASPAALYAGAEHLPDGAHPVCRAGGEVWCWGVQSLEALARHETGGCPGNDGDAPAWSVATALDAPVVHLVDADSASNDVKFKAGAELSKAVN